MKCRLPLLVAIFIILNLSACALTSGNGLAPIPSKEEFASFASRMPEGIDLKTASLSQFKSRLTEFISDYHYRAAGRRQLEWDSTGLVTYGGLGSVIGAVADKTGLLNTGAALAGAGLVTNSRYNFAQQSQVYFLAVKRLTCIHSKISSIPDAVLVDAKLSDDQNAADIASGAIKQLVDLVEGVRIEAVNGILGISPGVATRDELLAMLESYRKAQGQSIAAASASVDSATAQRRRQAGETIKNILGEAAACSKV